MRANVVCAYKKREAAKAIAAAIQPDNLQAPKGVCVKTRVDIARVTTLVELDGRIETLLATLDDLLACVSTAEDVL
ncbi:MAG: KEOPS complex subunit Pcc1 [Candidatus Hadarchaeaceae archaeon]